MKYLVNLFIIFVLFHGEVDSMVWGGLNNVSTNLNKSEIKTEAYRINLFRELNSAMDNHYNDLVKFLANEASRNRFKDWNEGQKTVLLFYGIENNLERVVKNCAESGFNLNARNRYGKTPLLLATELGHNAIAEYLLTEGADSNLVDIRTGFSALMFASWSGSESLVRTLIRNKANVNALSFLGCSPLSLAMGNNQKRTVQILKNAGADVYLKNQNGNTPMSIALYYSQKLAENDREKSNWISMVRILEEQVEQQEGAGEVRLPILSSQNQPDTFGKREAESVKPPARSSVWSFFRSFFRK